jgi:lipid II:glycine glycyltransferase (peptidoglycan interpeptide bridge formation enzyme)
MDCQEAMAAWDDLVFETPGSGYHQYSQWLSAYQSIGLKPRLWGIFDDGGILRAGVGAISVQLPVFGSRIAAALHGPVVPADAEDLWQEALPSLMELWKRERVACIQLQPCEYDDNTRVSKILDEQKAEQIQPFRAVKLPPATLSCQLTGMDEDEMLLGFRASTRQRLRKSLRNDVRVTAAKTNEDLATIYACYKEAADRIGFRPRAKQLLTTPLAHMIPRGHAEALGAYLEDRLIGFTVVLKTRHRWWYYKAGSTNEGRKNLVLYRLVWTVLQRAIADECIAVDLGERTSDGVEEFKRGFRPVDEQIIAPRSFQLNKPVVTAYSFVEKRLWSHRHKLMALANRHAARK